MSMINYASREINCKIVYYGSGLGGKTTNLEHIYGKVQPDTRGKLISLATETERTLFFDFLPVDLGTIRGGGDARAKAVLQPAKILRDDRRDHREGRRDVEATGAPKTAMTESPI